MTTPTTHTIKENVAASEATVASAEISAVVAHVRDGYERGVTRPLRWRRAQLDAMEVMLHEGTEQLTNALASDLGKPSLEAWTTEIGFVLTDIAHARSHLKDWTKPAKVSVPLKLQPGKARIVAEPVGTVLVLAPWNYPVQLLLSPMVAAITAGNAIVAKPSELAPATSAALVELTARYLDTGAIAVVDGGVDVATALLEEQFDHVFFTGSTNVGRIVMQAAAKHLTPVTLELGGKSPAIVTADADLKKAAYRIAWGKYLNAGQTCVAPDYVMIPRAQRDELVKHLKAAITKFYGADSQTSADYGRIISDSHHERLRGLITSDGAGTVVVGGTTDPDDRFIAPTVLVDTDPESLVMQEEIFGPVLPIVTIESLDEAIGFVNQRAKPLALYIFSKDQAAIDATIDRTSSGGVGINNTILHLAPPNLPFGGVGASGMGAYHGKTGFETFSHLKPVYTRAAYPSLSIVFPPYTKLKQRLLKRL